MNGRPASYNILRIRRFDRSCLRPDTFAGLGVAAYLVPQVMAYATLAGLDPVVGLWASLLPLIILFVVFWFLLSASDTFLRTTDFITGDAVGAIRLILVGLGLMLLMIFRPQGVLGDKREMMLDA